MTEAKKKISKGKSPSIRCACHAHSLSSSPHRTLSVSRTTRHRFTPQTSHRISPPSESCSTATVGEGWSDQSKFNPDLVITSKTTDLRSKLMTLPLKNNCFWSNWARESVTFCWLISKKILMKRIKYLTSWFIYVSACSIFLLLLCLLYVEPKASYLTTCIPFSLVAKANAFYRSAYFFYRILCPKCSFCLGCIY